MRTNTITLPSNEQAGNNRQPAKSTENLKPVKLHLLKKEEDDGKRFSPMAKEISLLLTFHDQSSGQF
jgi:hypothetical protein